MVDWEAEKEERKNQRKVGGTKNPKGTIRGYHPDQGVGDREKTKQQPGRKEKGRSKHLTDIEGKARKEGKRVGS